MIKLDTENCIPERSMETLQMIGRALGAVPDLFRIAALSPAALHSMWSQLAATGEMSLPPRVRGAIGLRVAELHGCDDSLWAHTAFPQQPDVDAEIAEGFRRGQSNDPKEQALLALTTKIVKDRGQHAGFVVETARRLGVTDAEIVEVVALIGLHTFMNYITTVMRTGFRAACAKTSDTSSCKRDQDSPPNQPCSTHGRSHPNH